MYGNFRGRLNAECIAMDNLVELGSELLLNTSHSPDLVLFENSKKSFTRQKVELNQRVMVVTEAYFENVFFKGVKEVGALLGQVDKNTRMLRKKSKFFQKFSFFFYRPSIY